MAASVLRRVAEAALSDLLDFFRIHSTVAAAADDEKKKSGAGDRDPGCGGGGGGGVNGGKEEGHPPRHDCPPLFKVRWCGVLVLLDTPLPSARLRDPNFNADDACPHPPCSHQQTL